MLFDPMYPEPLLCTLIHLPRVGPTGPFRWGLRQVFPPGASFQIGRSLDRTPGIERLCS